MSILKNLTNTIKKWVMIEDDDHSNEYYKKINEGEFIQKLDKRFHEVMGEIIDRVPVFNITFGIDDYSIEIIDIINIPTKPVTVFTEIDNKHFYTMDLQERYVTYTIFVRSNDIKRKCVKIVVKIFITCTTKHEFPKVKFTELGDLLLVSFLKYKHIENIVGEDYQFSADDIRLNDGDNSLINKITYTGTMSFIGDYSEFNKVFYSHLNKEIVSNPIAIYRISNLSDADIVRYVIDDDKRVSFSYQNGVINEYVLDENDE